MCNVRKSILIVTLSALYTGCGFVKLSDNNSASADDGEEKKTIAYLNESGLKLEAYDASLWGFIIDANSIDQPVAVNQSVEEAQTSPYAIPKESMTPSDSPGPGSPGTKAPPEPSQGSDAPPPPDAPTEKPATALWLGDKFDKKPMMAMKGESAVKGMVDDSLIAEDDGRTIYDAPVSRYRYIAVRKCLRLTTEIEDGLTASGIYCLQIEEPAGATCQSPRRLIRGASIRESLNGISDNNLDLGNVLTSKLGFSYDSSSRVWSRVSEGVTVSLSPLRIAALSLEGSCDDVVIDPSDPNSNPSESISSRINLSSRLAISRKIAVDDENRLYVAAGTPGTETVYGMVVARYLPNRDLDQSFGNGGYANIDGLQMNSEGFVVRYDQPRSRLLISGYAGTEWERVIVALRLDGSVDTSFGENGVATLGGMHMKFVISNEGYIYIMRDSSIIRLQKNGVLDTTFGKDGAKVIPLADNSYPVDFDMKDSDIYVISESGDRNIVTLHHLNALNDEVSSQAIQGEPGADMQSNSVAASDDMVIVFGRKINGNADGFFIAGFDRMGQFFPGFGENGVVSSAEGSSQNDVVFDSGNTFWIAGWGGIRQYNSSGQMIGQIKSNDYISADALVLGKDGSLYGAYVAHGGGEIFKTNH